MDCAPVLLVVLVIVHEANFLHPHRVRKPAALKNAPMEYAPANELGVVFLFAHVARRLQFRIEAIRPQFPDCIAYRRMGDSEKKTKIEFEFRCSPQHARHRIVGNGILVIPLRYDLGKEPHGGKESQGTETGQTLKVFILS